MSETPELLSRQLVDMKDVASTMNVDRSCFKGIREPELKIKHNLDLEQIRFISKKHVSLSDVYKPTEFVESAEIDSACRYVLFTEGGFERGGNSIVYKAFDRLLGQKCVAKVLSADENYTDGYGLTVFQREAEVMVGLENNLYLKNHIVRVRDVLLTSNGPWSSKGEKVVIIEDEMSIDTAPNLTKIKLSRLSLDEKIKIIEQAAKIVDELASNKPPVFHRDVKPGNLFYEKGTGILKISDFGSSNLVYRSSFNRGFVMNTEDFSAPETIKKGIVTDIGAEIYSIGVTAFWILSNGELPFDEDFSLEDRVSTKACGNFLTNFEKSRLDWIMEFLPKSSNSNKIRQVFEKVLAVDPKDRYNSAHEFFDDLKIGINKIVSFVRE